MLLHCDIFLIKEAGLTHSKEAEIRVEKRKRKRKRRIKYERVARRGSIINIKQF